MPCPLCVADEEEIEKIRSKAEPGKKGGVRERCLRFSFYFSLSFSD